MENVRRIWHVLIFINIWVNLIRKKECSCVLPTEIQNSDWNDVTLGENLTFSTNQMTGFAITLNGENKNAFTCISNTGSVYVFKCDQTYGSFPFSYPAYLCMKIVKVTDNLFYYHLLSDLDTTTVNDPAGGLRMYLPTNFGANGPDPVTTPTCDYCSFTAAHSNNEFRQLQKLGTAESVTSSDATLCLPCESDCSGSESSQSDSANDNIPLIVGLSVPLGVVAVTGVSAAIAVVLYKVLIVKGTKVAAVKANGTISGSTIPANGIAPK